MSYLPHWAYGGQRNPNSFGIEDFRYNDSVRDVYLDGVYNKTVNVGRGGSYGKVDIFNGWRINDFHKHKNNGDLLPYTPYRKHISYMTEVSGAPTFYVQYTQTNGVVFKTTWRWKDNATYPLFFPFVDFRVSSAWGHISEEAIDHGYSYLDRVHLQKAAAAIYGRGWDGMTFFAELHKVVRMFRNAVPRLLSLIQQAIRDATRRKVSPWHLLASQEWLAARYGWRILLYDIKDINELIGKLDKKELTRVKERQGDGTIYTVDRSQTLDQWWGGVTLNDYTSVEVSLRGSIIADFTPSKVIANPFLTTWELIPFSFVVDWFLHVGNALQAASFATVNSLYTGSVSLYYSSVRDMSTSGQYYASGKSGNWTDWTCKQVTDCRVRTPSSVSLLPLPNVNLNALKVVDLIALIMGTLSKLR